MKRLALVLVALSMVAAVGLAAKGDKGKKEKGKRTPPTVVGKVTAVDTEATPKTITIEPRKKKGGEAVGPQTLKVADDAKIIVNHKPGSLADIKALLGGEKPIFGAAWVKDDQAVRVMAGERKGRGPKDGKKKGHDK